MQGGFLEGHRGPGGGYSLTRPPSEITLLEVIKAVEGEDTYDHCVLGFAECGKANPCPLHDVRVVSKKNLIANLSQTTLNKLTAPTRERKLIQEYEIKKSG